MNEDLKIQNNTNIGSSHKISHYIPLGSQKYSDIPFVQKSREFMQSKKSASMRHIIDKTDKISIKINQNININANINNIKESSPQDKKVKDITFKDNKVKGSKPPSENSYESGKLKRTKSCVFNYKNKKKTAKKVISINLNRSKSRDIRDVESSYRMDKLLEKQSKCETKSDKKEQFFEFYINNNNANKIYKLKNNLISTTKYNVFTFIPKGLLFQFSRLSNVYFLFTAIIQSIPLISPLTSLTAIIPLIFVLGVSMIRELIEDLVRNNYDNINNEEQVIVFRNRKFVKAMSESLRHGEIILLYENSPIPADMIILDSSFKEGTCYVETSSLDGEKTLKLKVANKYTQGFISNDIRTNKRVEKMILSEKYFFSGYVKINTPNIDLNYVNGTLHTLFKKEGCKIEQDIMISTNELLV